MGFWDFDWAKSAYKWVDKTVSSYASFVTPDIIEKPAKATYKAASEYLIKPTVRSATVASFDAANIFEYVLADNYESIFKRKEYLERVRREGTLGYVTGLADQLITLQGTSDVGTGYLPGGEALRLSQEAILRDRPKVGELPYTLGRAGAYPGVSLGLYNQDSLIYKIISGGIDAIKVVKNPVDPFNAIPTLRPAGTGPSARVATGGTKIADKDDFARYFNRLEEEVLTLKEELDVVPRQLTDVEKVRVAEYNTLTQRTVPTRVIDVPNPLLPGTTKGVRAYEPGDIYEAWRPDLDEFLSKQYNQAGVVRDLAPSMIRNNYQQWRSSARGTQWAQDLIDGVQSGTLDAGQIWRTVLNREGPQAAALLASELAKPGVTIDDVWRIVDEAVASFEPGFNLRNIGRNTLDAVRMGDGNVLKYQAQKLGLRQFEILPESTRIGISDVAQSTRNLDNLMGSFGFDLPTRNEWLSKFFIASSGGKDELFKFLNEFEYQAIGDRLRSIVNPVTRKQVLDEDIIRELTSWTQKIADEIRLFSTDEIGNAVPLPWLDGDGIGPMRMTQQIGDDYFLMPPEMVNEVVRLTGVIGAYSKAAEGLPVAGRVFKFNDLARRTLQNYMSNYWKPSRVARPSHLIRVVPEEMLRGAASGVFEHPMEQMLAIIGNSFQRDALGNVIKGRIPNIIKLETKLDELENLLAEAKLYETNLANNVPLTPKQQKLVNRIPKIQKKITDLSAKIDADPQAIWDVLIGPRSRGAFASATGEYQGTYLQMHRRGIMQLPDRRIANQQKGWVKGIVQEVVDMAYNEDYRRIAQEKLFDDDLITINGKTASITQHIQDGAIHPYTGSPIANDMDAVKLWLFSGDGRRYFDQYFDNMANLKPQYKVGGYDNYAVASERVDTIFNHDIAWVTGFDQRLLDVIATGEFNGTRSVFRETTGRGSASVELRNWIENDFIQLPHAPLKVKFFPERLLTQGDFASTKGFSPTRGLQRMWNFYFEQMYGRGSDLLARSPTWKANYWNRLEELVPLMTKDDAQAAVQAARAANLTETRLERIQRQAAIANGSGTLEGASLLAEQYAVRATNDLLFNANKRSLFGVQHRIMFPFFEAFREVSQTWLKLAAMNPRIIRNTAQFVDSTQTSGAFTTNADGRKVFEIPLSGKIASMLIGSDNTIVRNFTVGVDSVNIALQMRPGFGPVLQYVVDDFAPATPEWDWLRSFASPYGFSSPLETFVPAPPALAQILQLTRGIPGVKDVELLDQVINAVTNYEQNSYKQSALIWSHRFLLNNYSDKYRGVDGFNDAFDDAEIIANRITFLRGLLAFVGPGAPLTTWVTETQYGSFDAAIVIDDLRNREDKARAEGRPSSDAFGEWLATWGQIVWPYTGSITKSNIGGQIASTEFNDWVRDNEQLVKEYPLVAGYLGPRTGDRSFEAWVQQSQAGRRQIKDVRVEAEEASQRLGNYLYYSYKDQLAAQYSPRQMASPDVRRLLANKLDEVKQQLPLFVPPGEAGAARRLKTQRQIQQLRAISKNPDLQNNSVVQTLREYFAVVDQSIANTMAENRSVNIQNWGTAKAAKGLRIDIDTRIAPQLIAKNPAFRDVYEQVLSYEFVLDED